MAPMLEVTSLYLKPGVDITEAPNNIKYKSSIGALTGQPGFQILWEGTSQWNPEFLVWLIGWDNITSHETFIAQKEQYAKMVNPLLELAATEREDFIHIRHLPPSSSFLDLSSPMTLSSQQGVAVFWLRVSERGSLGRFANAVRGLQGALRERDLSLAGGELVEQSGECIVFVSGGDPACLVRREDVAVMGGESVDVVAGGAFRMTAYIC
ncbi:hypothetical protein BO71DRAFT_405067 [Aspergillus ellipticus CBS 707.79]|uniref:ABM domain-containing protein n=1 Tax=Aspergillus ellipticus CBS 707.79 TaxID=1448320 RepID=A0A319DU00_9EURO|nr:hypothetical protein BO71DRAFT_405067 [Aspergillus ellipticus CBS 707.79]